MGTNPTRSAAVRSPPIYDTNKHVMPTKTNAIMQYQTDV